MTEILLSKEGDYLYVTKRGHVSIAVFKRDINTTLLMQANW